MGLKQFTKDANSGDAWGGSIKGAAKGAAVGSVVPVVGTVAGGVIGGIAGGISGMFKHRAKRKAGEAAQTVAEAQREAAQKELNRRRTVLANVAKALDREGFYDSAGGISPSAFATDDWTLPAIPKAYTGSWEGDFSSGLDSAMDTATAAIMARYNQPTVSPVGRGVPGRAAGGGGGAGASNAASAARIAAITQGARTALGGDDDYGFGSAYGYGGNRYED